MEAVENVVISNGGQTCELCRAVPAVRANDQGRVGSMLANMCRHLVLYFVPRTGILSDWLVEDLQQDVSALAKAFRQILPNAPSLFASTWAGKELLCLGAPIMEIVSWALVEIEDHRESRRGHSVQRLLQLTQNGFNRL